MNKNAYVGGDAYNYIINGNYATAFFVLATLFTLMGIGFIIIGYLDSIKSLKLNKELSDDGINDNTIKLDDEIRNEKTSKDLKQIKNFLGTISIL